MKVFFSWIINKKVLFPALGLVVLLSLFPPTPVYAVFPFLLVIGGIALADLFLGGPVTDFIISEAAAPLLEAFLAFFNIILGIIAGILQVFYIGLGETLHAIIRYFMGIAISPSSEEVVPFVREAFAFSQMFVNSLFILILVFIGLATILRLQTYQLQHTLPRLLIVALLVNFSGVLVGFVVDMGNIIANFFLNASIDTAWQTNPWQAIALDAENVGQNIARILYYIFGVFIYFIVMLLFGVRVIILWMLSILAPFAFAALVLPATRSYWTRWWGLLIQWSIIGIPISFFLYLSGRAISAQLPAGDGISQTVLAVFAPMSALLLLFIGVMLSMQMAPAGAQGVIKFGRGVPGRLAQTRLGSKLLSKAATEGQKILSRESRLIQGPRQYLEKRGGKVGKAFTWATRQTAGRAFGGANRLWGGKLTDYAAGKRRMTLPKNFDQMSEQELEAWSGANHLDNEDLIQFAARMQDKKKYKHTTDAFKESVNKAIPNVAQKRWLHPDMGTLLDVVPETVGAEILEALETGASGDQGAIDKFQKELGEVKKTVRQDLGEDGLTLEAALKYKLITKISEEGEPDRYRLEEDGTERSRAETLSFMQTKLTAPQKDSFLNDLAASVKYTRELKPQDIANVIKPKNLSFRLAMRDANASSIQALLNNFDRGTFDNVMNGLGGVGQLDAEELYTRNAKMFNFFTENPVGRIIDWKGRDTMLNIAGDKTSSMARFRERARVFELIKDKDKPFEAQLSMVYDSFQQQHSLGTKISDIESTIAEEGVTVPQETVNKLTQAKETLKDLQGAFQAFREHARTENDQRKQGKMDELLQLLKTQGGNTGKRQQGDHRDPGTGPTPSTTGSSGPTPPGWQSGPEGLIIPSSGGPKQTGAQRQARMRAAQSSTTQNIKQGRQQQRGPIPRTPGEAQLFSEIDRVVGGEDNPPETPRNRKPRRPRKKN